MKTIEKEVVTKKTTYECEYCGKTSEFLGTINECENKHIQEACLHDG